MATCLALNQETSVRFPPPEICLDTPIGRAARLKSERVWVRIPLQANCRLQISCCTSKGANRVLPFDICNGQESSWSSLECSSPCHGEGRGFKSHRGRYLVSDCTLQLDEPSLAQSAICDLRLPGDRQRNAAGNAHGDSQILRAAESAEARPSQVSRQTAARMELRWFLS